MDSMDRGQPASIYIGHGSPQPLTTTECLETEVRGGEGSVGRVKRGTQSGGPPSPEGRCVIPIHSLPAPPTHPGVFFFLGHAPW